MKRIIILLVAMSCSMAVIADGEIIALEGGLFYNTENGVTLSESYYSGLSVQEQPPNLSGRIAYQSYSDYLSVPAEGDTEDGNIFIYSFEGDGYLRNLTESLVVNAMNPDLSPDGSKVTFTAIPMESADDIDGRPGYEHRLWINLEIFVYDLATESLYQLTNNKFPDEDGKFSPDGSQIVFKSSGQVHTMNVDGSLKQQLTYTGDEKSGPNFSLPDGSNIVYWSGDDADADIWMMNSDGTGAEKIISVSGISEYYPICWTYDVILYTQWENSSTYNDKIYKYSISSGLTEPLSINEYGVDDSDPFPIDDDNKLIGFSSSRGQKYDLYIGDTTNGSVYPLPGTNTRHHDLGGSYSPLTHARKLVIINPLESQEFGIGQDILFKVSAYSDGGIWTGISPDITVFNEENTYKFAGLTDDGIMGDDIAGDGIYSKLITLPPISGIHYVTASAISIDNWYENYIESGPVEVFLTSNPSVIYYCDDDYDDHTSASLSGVCTGIGCELECLTTPGDDCDDENPAVKPGADDSNCDNVDDDCNGTPDDAYVPIITYCGQGVCSSTGQLICDNGEFDTCASEKPEATHERGQKCKDGIDNDCDGRVDGDDTDCRENNGGDKGTEGRGKTCSDKIDNDGDELTDCADYDCSNNKACR
jgi:Tol biopolymer transport system component